jgi:HK97 family phage major capsid protein
VAAVTKDELRSEIADKKSRLEEIDAENAGERFTEETREEWNRMNGEVDDLESRVEELEARERRLAELSDRPENVEKEIQFPRPGVARGDDIYDLSTVRRSYVDPEVEGRELRDRASRAIEMARFPHDLAEKRDARGHVERLIEKIDDTQGTFSRYILETGQPGYKRAFTKYLAGAPRSPGEEQMLYRAMSLTTTSGGFAVPFVLDPTIIPTSSGALNPYRAISNVKNISVDEWRGVSSAGVTAAFAAEAAVTTDNAPTLAQPTVSTERAQAFIPFSIEIGQDWGSFASEMAALLQDSKDELEATKFAVGSGTNEPFGVITGATTVFTASNTNSLVVADIYGVHSALGQRFRSRAVWTLNNAVADRIRQLDTAGGANLWVDNLRLRSAAQADTMMDARMGADLLGKAAYEASGQSGTFTTGQLIGVVGDYGRGFVIADRVGLSIETIPHLFGAAQGNLPTGQRGLYAFWRTGSKVVHANMFRTLKLA